MDMTTNAINKIQEMAVEAAGKKIIENNGEFYKVDGDGDVSLIVPKNLADSAVELNTLDGFIEFIKTINERKDQAIYVHIKSANKVVAFTHLDAYGRREYLAETKAILPAIPMDDFIDAEKANIIFQSQFKQTKDRDLILKVIGNLKEEKVHQANDDGVSQAVSVKTGVASVSNVKVPNPVKLAPYRTFAEVEQPVSEFIFRLQDGMQCAIFEADNKAWQLEAIKNIQDYLTKGLQDLIQTKHITIIA